MILRTVHNRENPFVMLNREALNDPKLSLKARGLWATCMSKPDDWHFHVSALVKELKEGKTAIYSAIKELIEAGYCIRGQKRTIEGGQFDSVEYFICEFPATENDKKLVDDMYLKNKVPHSGFPHAENPHTENQPLLNRDSKRKDKTVCCDGAERPDRVGKSDDVVGDFPNTINVKTGDGPTEISFSDMLVQFVRKDFKTEELREAWKILAEYKGVVYNWIRFIEGTIDRFRKKHKSKKASADNRSSNRKDTLCQETIQKESEKCNEDCSETDMLEHPWQRSRKSLQDLLDESRSGLKEKTALS